MKVDWHYHCRGAADGPPILFLHGFMAHGGIWLPTMEQLPEGFRSIALDLPGHGQTDADLKHMTFDALSDVIAAFAGITIRRPAILVGYSMGGRIALRTALRHPGYFCGLVLESANPGIENSAARKERLTSDKKWADKLRQGDIRAFLQEWYTQPVFSSLHRKPELIEQIIQKKSDNNPGALAEVMFRLSQGKQPPLWDQLQEWEAPTLIIAGELDQTYTDIARRMATSLKNPTLRIVPDAGHIVHLENNKDFVAALKFFLSSYIL
jgi:2-succinyl-6-hydroxy-2,4-cyclohexadiene-1-carboxylate synthase